MSIGDEPAFPYTGDSRGNPGLTKREYFIAKAMQGLLACPTQCECSMRLEREAVRRADALIAELSKKGEG